MMRDSESGLILRVAVLLVQQTLRFCAAVREFWTSHSCLPLHTFELRWTTIVREIILDRDSTSSTAAAMFL